MSASIVAASSLASCSSTSGNASADAGPTCDPAATATSGDLPEDVNAVLVEKCQACHQSPPKNRAPFPLLSFEDTQLQFGITAKRKWQRMAEVIEPGGAPHMPLSTAPQLTDTQLATLRNWFSGCAQPIPEGTGHDHTDDGGGPER